MEELATLVRAACNADLDAYGRLVRRFQDMAYGYAYSVLGDFHLAEDAAQEAFVEAFRDLGQLREPGAFPGWLRRIVFKWCDRLTRGKRVTTVPLDAAAEVAGNGLAPSRAAEDREMRDKVIEAIRSLPEHERTVTALFYINGYSQDEIADFLEVPVNTVKSRLHRSRNRLKQRMLDMVEETLQHNAPDERLSRQVIDRLLARPRPLEIPGHPIREIVDAVRAALPDYEWVEGEEIIDREALNQVQSARDQVYEVDADRVLRSETTVATLGALAGRTPPVRLITAGRVFRAGLEQEEPTRLSVFHQLDVLHAAPGLGKPDLEAALRRLVDVVLGPLELRHEPAEYRSFDQCVEVAVDRGGQWTSIAGGGVLAPDTLRQCGLDPAQVSGYAFGLGLERLAMLKLGLDDIRKLWRPPYVPE